MSKGPQNNFSEVSVDERIDPEESMHQIRTTRRVTPHYGCLIPIMVDPITKLPRYFLGPHFYIFGIALAVSIGLLVFIIKSLFGKTEDWKLGLTVLLGLHFVYCYVKIGFSNPGIASQVQMPGVDSQKSQKYCTPCRIVRPAGTRHCYYCDICITQLDHHCPWVGKCIGKNNICLFYYFLLSLFGLLVWMLYTSLTANIKKAPQN